jgi:hypothetical protein
MNVIGHNYVSAKCDIEVLNCAVSVLLQSNLSVGERRNLFAVASRKRDEEKRLTDVNETKSVRTILDHCYDCRGSRVGCNPHATGVSLQRKKIRRRHACHYSLRSSQAHRANQPPPLKPAQPKNTEEPTGDCCGLGNDVAIYLDVIELELEIGAIGLPTGEQ